MTSPYHPAPQDPIPESTSVPATPAQESAPAAPQPPYVPVAAPQVPPATDYLQPGGVAPHIQAPLPPLPAAPVYRYPASALHAGVRAVIGGVLIVAAIVAAVFGNRFPYNAPVEQLMNFGLILVLASAGVTLLVFAGLTAKKMSHATIPGRTSPLAITAFCLNAVTLVIWVVTILPAFGSIADGDRLRFMNLAGALFFLGFVWGTAIVMGALSLRSVGGKSRIFATLSVAIGVILVIGAVTPAVLYGLGLTD